MSDVTESRTESVLRGYPLAVRVVGAIESGPAAPGYERLCRNIDVIDAALAALSPEEREVVALLFFGERRAGISRAAAYLGNLRTAWRWRGRLLKKLSPALIEADSVLFRGEDVG